MMAVWTSRKVAPVHPTHRQNARSGHTSQPQPAIDMAGQSEQVGEEATNVFMVPKLQRHYETSNARSFGSTVVVVLGLEVLYSRHNQKD